MAQQPPISDYALLGDCETAALVDKSGSIDWLCWPRFDSESCFTRLLGTDEHGYWQITPQGPSRTSRAYRPGTLILETRFETSGGVVILIDFMPVRKAEGRESSLRFSYGTIVPWVTRVRADAIRAMAGPHSVILNTPIPLRSDPDCIQASFTMQAGDTLPFVLTYEASHLPLPPAVNALEALETTQDIWREWAARSTYDGPWNEAVQRSLVTIKALTYHPTGGVLAAPSTSLPEKIGGVRNWDYRFCWLRDSTFTLLSLLNAGYRTEAEQWCDWLLRAVAGAADQLQPLYGLAGELCIGERELPWLPGYRGSRPVRVGNDATTQLQLDVFGSVLDTLHEAHCAGLELHEARTLFERVLALRNDVGLLAEQYDTQRRMQVGNFPQAFSHFALIDTAFNFHGDQGAAGHHAQAG